MGGEGRVGGERRRKRRRRGGGGGGGVGGGRRRGGRGIRGKTKRRRKKRSKQTQEGGGGGGGGGQEGDRNSNTRIGTLIYARYTLMRSTATTFTTGSKVPSCRLANKHTVGGQTD